MGKHRRTLMMTRFERYLGPQLIKSPAYLTSVCNVGISLVMSFTGEQWYLSSKGCLGHLLHVQKHAIYETITANDLDGSEKKFMNIFFKEDIKPSVIGRIMECLRNQKDKCGRLHSM